MVVAALVGKDFCLEGYNIIIFSEFITGVISGVAVAGICLFEVCDHGGAIRGVVAVTVTNRVATSYFGGNGVRSWLKPKLRYHGYCRGDSKGRSTQSEPG